MMGTKNVNVIKDIISAFIKMQMMNKLLDVKEIVLSIKMLYKQLD